MAREATRLIIQGRVQGVGYRWWALRRARELGLAGWVRNRADGSVEALAIGQPESIAAFARSCQEGPPHALVETVTAAPATDDGSETFEQRESA